MSISKSCKISQSNTTHTVRESSPTNIVLCLLVARWRNHIPMLGVAIWRTTQRLIVLLWKWNIKTMKHSHNGYKNSFTVPRSEQLHIHLVLLSQHNEMFSHSEVGIEDGLNERDRRHLPLFRQLDRAYTWSEHLCNEWDIRHLLSHFWTFVATCRRERGLEALSQTNVATSRQLGTERISNVGQVSRRSWRGLAEPH